MPGMRRLNSYLPIILALSLGASATAGGLLREGSRLIRDGQAEQALQLFQSASEAGDPAGDYALGVLYFQGTGVKQDLIKSSRYFLKAAQEGHALAQYNLGNAYINARGVQLSLDQAEYWWRKAAAQGYVRAQYNLGALLKGQGTRPGQHEEGIAWLRAAAQGGFPKAWHQLIELDEPLDYLDISQQPERQPLRDEARLLSYKPQGYLIQLFSGKRAASAEQFIRNHQLGNQGLRFRFPLKGETWTGVSYDGWYASAEDARATVKNLKTSLREAGPWLRPVKEVQDLIRKTRQASDQNKAGVE